MAGEKEKDIKVIRGLIDSVKQQICAAVDLLDEPFKSTFLNIKKEFDDVVAKLPATDAVPAALEMHQQLNSLWSCLYSVNSLVTFLNQSLDGIKKNAAGQLNSAVSAEIARLTAAGELIGKEAVSIKVQEQVTTLTTAGELVPKDTVAQLCAAAKTNGVTEGETKVRAEVAAAEALAATVNTRKAALTTAGLPLPETEVAAVLGSAEEVFTAARTTAETRLAELKSKGIQLSAESPLRAKVWLAENDYKTFMALAESLPGVRGEPFAGNPNPNKREPLTTPRFIV